MYLSRDSGDTWESIEATYTVGQIRSTDIYNDYLLAGNPDGLYGYKVTPVYIQDEIGEQLDFKVYPNPASSNVNITSTDGFISEICIYNKLGQRVIHEIKPGNTIDVSMLPEGLYIVEVVLNGHRVRESLIVQ